ncbi:MAG: cytochrome c3 family protein [Candidatus Sumerlaeia bacterium]
MNSSRVFPPCFNAIARWSIVAAIALAGAGAWGWYRFTRSEFVELTGYPVEQPVQFSHMHHVSRLGIDCRMCHASVETSSFAGMPPTYTCMTCHSQIWRNTAMLAPIRESLDLGRPMQWRRVYDLPRFVYFDHRIHVAKGIGCASCHGAVDRMPLVALNQPLHMRWCLDCHRRPERFARPKELVFDMKYKEPADQIGLGRRLVSEYGIRKLTDCSVCHR